ncbi:MAG: hypothetical protein FWG35_06265 [Spirochaetaceae bacterium]|nr:hypothetical protein [Spirochaetaceae bacterium]
MKINLSRIPLIALILAAALSGCSSAPSEQTDGIAAPASGSGALTGTWKLAAQDSSSQVIQFQNDGTGTLTVYDAQGKVTNTTDISYAFDDGTRFRLIGKEWVTLVPCEVQGSQLTLPNTGQVFTKE